MAERSFNELSMAYDRLAKAAAAREKGDPGDAALARAASPTDALRWVASAFPGRAALGSSLGLEDQILTHIIAEERLPIGVFTLDTGRLFPETHDLIERTRERYRGISIQVLFPEAGAVEDMVNSEGPNLFRKSVGLRRRCCQVRKVEPLRRALSNLDAWVCGLRREQSVTRDDLEAVQWDAGNGLLKVSPLADWTERQVWDCVRANEIPYSALHDKGFPSIGCACCTRAVGEGEDPRAGRWWWESTEHKECGLHRK